MRNFSMIVLVAVLAFSHLSCVSKSKYVAIQTELGESQERAKELEDTLTVSNLDLDKLQKSKSELDKTCRELLEDKVSLELEKMELEKETKTYKQLVNSLEKEIESGEVTISQMKDRLTVNLIDKVLFDSGSTSVKSTGKETLAKVASILERVNDKQIQVNGHTDNVPIGRELRKKYSSNWELAAARSTAVVQFLIEKNVKPNHLVVAGYSMYQPIASNATEKGRRENRRIEIVLVPKPSLETP